MKARTGGILERIADGIADYSGCVNQRFLPLDHTFRIFEFTGLDELLGVIPGAAGIGHEDRQKLAGNNHAAQKSG